MFAKKMFAALALGAAAAGFALACSAQETITARADVWAPFNGEPQAAEPGYGVEILKAIFEPKGVKIDYQNLPWNRTLKDVEAGKFDIAIAANPKESASLLYPQEEFGVIEYHFFVKAGSPWSYKGIDSLKQIKLACVEDYSYSDALDSYIAENKRSEKVQAMTGDDPMQKNVKKLLAGRVDALVECPQVVFWSLKELKLSEKDLASAGKLEEAQKIYMGFSPAKESSKRYAKMFDEGMKELRASGKLKEILAKYGLKDWR